MRTFERSRSLRNALFGCLLVAATTLLAAQAASAQCVGDCDGNTEVTVDEIVTMVNAALTGGNGGCPNGDADSNGEITVDEIITAVNNALSGCPGPETVCGNGATEGTEQCDDGGFCLGGSNAGTACDAESDCEGPGACIAGPGTGKTCDNDSDCPESRCVHCRSFGGDGCAANCTTETSVAFDLEPGVQLGADDLEPGTSGVIVYSSFLNIPLPLMGSLVATVGSERGGVIPMVVKADDIEFPAIPVLSLACACVGGAPAKTCGGVVFEADGTTLAEDCTNDDSACAGKPPCSFLHGPGNTISGIIGCDGLSAINLEAVLENGETTLSLSGAGPAGSALVIASIDIRIVLGGCTGTGGDYGADGMFCTADDPPTDLTVVGTGPTTTGNACGTVKGDSPEFDVGPACRQGSPASCVDGNADISGMCLVTAFPFGDVEQLGDLVGTITLCAK